MTLIHLDGTGTVTFHHSQGSADGELACTLGISTSSTNLQQIVDKCAKVWQLRVMPIVTAKSTFQNATILFKTGGAMFSGVSTVGAGTVGSQSATNSLPSQTAIVVAKVTQFAGRQHRGRLYLPNPSIGLMGADQNTLSGTYLPQVQTAMDGVLTDLLNGSYSGYTFQVTPVVLHSSASLPADAITAFSVRARLGTVRGRIR